MNKQKFEQVMTMVDDDLLEEAAAYRAPKKKRLPMLAGAAVACLLVAVSAFSFFGADMGTEEQQTTIANPMQKISSAEIAQLGYNVPLPADAAEEEYFLINTGAETPMAEVRFLSNDTRYTCRTLKTDEPADISGIYAAWAHDYNWETEELQIHLAQDIFQAHGIQQEHTLHGKQAQLTGSADHKGFGRDDTVGMAELHQAVHGDLPAAETVDQVDVDDADLALITDTLHQGIHIHHIAIEQEYHLAIRFQGPEQLRVFFHRCDNGGVQQQFLGNFQNGNTSFVG